MKTAFPFVQIYRTLGQRWTDRGWLRQPGGNFFLTVPDVERIFEAGDPASAGLDLHTLTVERRRAYEYWFDVEAPEVIGPDGRPLGRPEEKSTPAVHRACRDVETAEVVLRGIAASGGEARGTARLIRDWSDMYQLQQGDILVARAQTRAGRRSFRFSAASCWRLGVSFPTARLSRGSTGCRRW